MRTHLVATGIVIIPCQADSPREAISVLKKRIDLRRHEDQNHVIGMSLVEAQDAGRLNYAVLDDTRTRLLCAEIGGRLYEPVPLDVQQHWWKTLPDALTLACEPPAPPSGVLD